MATYYKYKERDLDKSMIDWSGLTKTISDNLLKEKADREKRKFELEESYQEQLSKINEYEQGVDPTANEFAMKQAQQARDFLMENHKLMKAGLRPVNDSKLIKQRVGDTWTTLSGSLKTYNENFKRLSELDGKGNEAVLKAMSDQLDLKGKQIYYDPNTGAGYYVSVDKNGEIDMNTAVPVKALTNIQHQEFDTIDVNAEAAKVAKNAAQWKTFLSSTTDIKDARLNPNYKNWIDNTAKSALSSNEKVASVLMDYLGIEYNTDGTPSKRTVSYQRVKEYGPNGELIMEDVSVDVGDVEMKFNPKSGKLEPQLTDKQKKYAGDAYKNAIEINIAREASKDYVRPIKDTPGEKSDKSNTTIIDDFVLRGQYSGLKALLQNVASDVQLSPDGDKLTVIKKDGTAVPIQLKNADGSNVPSRDVGVSIAGIIDPKFAGTYRNQSKASTSQGVNTGVYDTTIYDELSRKVSLSPEQIQGLDTVMLPKQMDDGFGGVTIVRATSQQINAQLTSVGKSLGLDPNLFKISKDPFTNIDSIYYDNQEIGIIGETTGTQLAQKLSGLAAEGGAPIPE